MISHILERYRRQMPDWLLKHYLLHSSKFYKGQKIKRYDRVESDDIVLDIGAYWGEFSIPSSYYGKKVYSIEPDPIQFRKLNRMCANISNIEVFNFAIWNKNKTIKFDIADNADSSISTIGTDTEKKFTKLIPAYRLDSLNFIDKITYIKLDAEGGEPEVIKSLGKYRPNRISVDIGEPRNDGKNPKNMVLQILQNMGYSIIHEKPVRYDNPNILKAKYEN